MESEKNVLTRSFNLERKQFSPNNKECKILDIYKN
jgi:hypothetical protein